MILVVFILTIKSDASYWRNSKTKETDPFKEESMVYLVLARSKEVVNVWHLVGKLEMENNYRVCSLSVSESN